MNIYCSIYSSSVIDVCLFICHYSFVFLYPSDRALLKTCLQQRRPRPSESQLMFCVSSQEDLRERERIDVRERVVTKDKNKMSYFSCLWLKSFHLESSVDVVVVFPDWEGDKVPNFEYMTVIIIAQLLHSYTWNEVLTDVRYTNLTEGCFFFFFYCIYVAPKQSLQSILTDKHK